MRKQDLIRGFLAVNVSVLLLTIYSVTAFLYFPDGVTKLYLERLGKLTLACVPMVTAVFILYIKFYREEVFTYTKKLERFDHHDFNIALLPMLPVIGYLAANQDILSLLQTAFLFIFFLSISVLICSLIPVWMSFFTPKFVLQAVSTGFLFSIYNMPVLSEGKELVPFISQIFILGGGIVVLLLLGLISKKVKTRINLMVFGTVLVMGVILAQDFIVKPGVNVASLPAMDLLAEKNIVKKPDILFIIYESYANYETMLHYGLDNRDHLKFLKNNNFNIHNGVYSLGTPTLPAMSTTLNMNRELLHKRYIIGDSVVHNLLQKEDYITYSCFFSEYFFRGFSLGEIERFSTDSYFPPSRKHDEILLMIEMILKGDFGDALVMKRACYDSYLTEKYRAMYKKDNKFKFMYSHSGYPGHRMSSDHNVENVEKAIGRYKEGVIKANEEMKKDVQKAIEDNPDSIVIIAGDHGPLLTKTGYGLSKYYSAEDIDRYDLQDRYGAFLAIRWPEPEYAGTHDIQILQDVFPAVFSYLFDENKLYEQLKIENTRTIPTDYIPDGVYIEDGIVFGGINDGESLFLGPEW